MTSGVEIAVIVTSGVSFCIAIGGLYLLTSSTWGREPWWRHWRKTNQPAVMVEHLDGYNRVTSRTYYELEAAPKPEVIEMVVVEKAQADL